MPMPAVMPDSDASMPKAPTSSQWRMLQDPSSTRDPQGRTGYGMGYVCGQAQLGGCEHGAVLQDGDKLPPQLCCPTLPKGTDAMFYSLLFPLHFF